MKLNANGTEVTVLLGTSNQDDFISLTDIAKKKDAAEPRVVISNWLSSYSTIDFLATWECLYNPNFNRLQFQTVSRTAKRLENKGINLLN